MRIKQEKTANSEEKQIWTRNDRINTDKKAEAGSSVLVQRRKARKNIWDTDQKDSQGFMSSSSLLERALYLSLVIFGSGAVDVKERKKPANQ
ncbi:MAG: hypothetical protein EHM41_22200 [Chloroflexi bacterium]|nr:MAG: hypothetical protein EHM41_22200 [Chloroflexota bacterium]